MKIILFIIFWVCCSGQYYSRIRIYEYTDYTDMTFLKFNIENPTKLANWTVSIGTYGKCSDDLKTIHLYEREN